MMDNLNGLTIFDGEYVNNGTIYCKKCNGKKSLEITLFNQKKTVRCLCSCEIDEDRKKREQQAFIENQIKIDTLTKKSLIGEKYKNVTFENCNLGDNTPDYKKACSICADYCKNAKRNLKEGKGLYIFGEPGVGKTYLTACVANKLLQSNYSVLFSNEAQISAMVKCTYKYNSTENEDDVINKIASMDFLIIDDFGTEKFFSNGENTWFQNIIYQIINRRYNDLKPIIFTSNYSPSELIIDRKLHEKTLDRICEICPNIIKIKGFNFRLNYEELC